MNNVMPRFRGIAVETEEGWRWQLLITLLGNNNGFEKKSDQVFPTKEKCIADLRNVVRILCDELQMEFIGKPTGEYIDMKTNETLKWDKEKQN